MMKRLIAGHDEQVAAWTFVNFNVTPHKPEMAIAIVEDDQIIGSILWEQYTGNNIEISYYGPNTMTLGIARACAKMAMDHWGVSRVTARTSRGNKQMTRGIKGVGFEYEGICHDHYGKGQDAIMYGLYGHKLARLAGKQVH